MQLSIGCLGTWEEATSHTDAGMKALQECDKPCPDWRGRVFRNRENKAAQQEMRSDAWEPGRGWFHRDRGETPVRHVAEERQDLREASSLT